jgi:hypothetical protein
MLVAYCDKKLNDYLKEESTMSATVIEHVLGRLNGIGISQVFGVAGDYVFSVEDAIVKSPGIERLDVATSLMLRMPLMGMDAFVA